MGASRASATAFKNIATTDSKNESSGLFRWGNIGLDDNVELCNSGWSCPEICSYATGHATVSSKHVRMRRGMQQYLRNFCFGSNCGAKYCNGSRTVYLYVGGSSPNFHWILYGSKYRPASKDIEPVVGAPK